ncbi:MAG: YbaN family protein [Gemmatimonadetes bacterium]|jgi:uncharacterized protein|nr:YbaN family protein [Gemmatimonadota bacterium]
MRILLLIAGTLALLLALLGIFLPLLPTTPFLLLAAWCYARSSARFHQLLLTNRWFGPYLRNYQQGRGMPARARWITLIMLWSAILLAAAFVAPLWWSRLLLIAIATGVTIYLRRLPTLQEAPGTDDTDMQN